MKVNSINNFYITNPQKFKGLMGGKSKSMFVFDLDGTLDKVSSDQMEYIQDKAKECRATLVYATGRPLFGYLSLRSSMRFGREVNLMEPDYLVCDNGGHLYKNEQGILKEDKNYRSQFDTVPDFLRFYLTDKAEGIKYIKSKEGIKYSEILMAGDDVNDIPMARLSLKGSKFICMNNAARRLMDFCSNNSKNTFRSENSGAKSLIEGIDYFTKSK